MAGNVADYRLWIIVTLLSALNARFSARAEPTAVNTAHIRLRGPTGHPCLDFQMFVRPQLVNSDEFDHTVQVRNSCVQPVRVKLCYKNAKTDCRKLRLRPYGEATTLLGSMYKRPNFSFSYTETLDDD